MFAVCVNVFSAEHGGARPRRSSLRHGAVAVITYALCTAAIADERFKLVDTDNVVEDRQTQLHWQRDGTRQALNLAAATSYCAALQLGKARSWRLPTVKELISLVDEAHYKPSAFPVFLTVSNLYWSSSVNTQRPGLSWTVNFSDGHVHAFREALDFSVRCVSDQ